MTPKMVARKKEGIFHQRNALEILGRQLGRNGLVVYAAPAIETFQELFRIIQAGDLIDNTNFARIEKLQGHVSYTY